MDLRFARLCHLIAVGQGVKIDGREPRMDDFIMRFEPKEKESDEMIALKINMIMESMK